MNIFFKLFAAAALTTAASSCQSFLDINENPNAPLTVTPDALLANALSTTATNYTGGTPSYNSYGSWTAGYWGRSGVVNGYTDERTYNYSNTFYGGLWTVTYRNINDYNIIQTQGANSGFAYHAAIARIMKVYNYQLLVDEYGDIPYTDALGGLGNRSPKYDKAADIYRDFIVQLDGAITDINAAVAKGLDRSVGSEDIVFQGNLTNWKRFANSLKLRILLRESQTNDAALNTYVAAQMTRLQTATDGFILADVVAQPGYLQSAGKQNPFFDRYGITAAGQAATERNYQIPTNFILRQYSNNSDPRLAQLYGAGTNGGYLGTDLGERLPPLITSGVGGGASRFRNGGGLLKGFNAPTALMLLSEHLFNRAEAETRSSFTGGNTAAKASFLGGVAASFSYFYRPAISGPATVAGATQYNAYISANATNPLVNFDLAPTSGTLGKQSVIIYQKYLAMNTVASIEAWCDYRRTGQPAIPASLESTSPRADKLPTRLLYPNTEVNTNAGNIPTGTTQYTLIFWDPN